MEYTVQKLASLAGVSARTLRYYDEIGLLPPQEINASGYRVYGPREVDLLQQILFYRELGVELSAIAALLCAPQFDVVDALRTHRQSIVTERNRLNKLIRTLEKTIDAKNGGMIMNDKEKFNGFKKKLVEDNEKKYGAEVRQKYGDDTVDDSNAKLMNMSEAQYKHVEQLSVDIAATLKAAKADGDPAGELAQKACALHKEWICNFWKEYSKEAHMGLGQMYVDDPRFTAHYDKEEPGTAVFLRDALQIFTRAK